MKTSTFPLSRTPIYVLIGFIGVFLNSCGSYQNSSYYDKDGIYGGTQSDNTQSDKALDANKNYKEYFSSLQKENQSNEIFTDIDSYRESNSADQSISSDYRDWGNNYQKASINIYPNQFGPSLGMGWGFPSYGWGYNNYGWGNPAFGGGFGYFGWDYPLYYGYAGFGWNYPYYGWGFPNYGWNYPFYGFSNYGYYNRGNYSYSPSRRGSTYSNNRINPRDAGNNVISREYSQNRLNGSRSRNYRNEQNGARTNSAFGSRRIQEQNNASSPSSRRANSVNSRSESSDQSRSYSPNTRSDSNSSSRSYSSGSNDSGRSYSGGGRRR